MSRFTALVSIGVVSFCVAQSSFATITFVDLNPAGAPGSVLTGVYGTNQVGYLEYPNGDHAAIWSGASNSLVDLNPPGASDSQAYGIYGTNQVGTADFTNGYHAVLWSGSSNSFVDLNPPGASNSEAMGISGNQEVGDVYDGVNQLAALWTGTSNSVVYLTSSGFSVANGTTGSNQVGYAGMMAYFNRAALWSGSSNSLVNLQPAGVDTSVVMAGSGAIQAGGVTLDPGDQTNHAAMWMGTSNSFVDLNPAGTFASQANGVSGGFEAGEVLFSTNYESDRAVIWSGTAASALDLNSVLGTNYALSRALAIWFDGSNTLYVAGSATYIVDPNDESTWADHAILWTVPLADAQARLEVNLAPTAAVAAGVQWQVDGGPSQANGATATLPAGPHTISFTTVSGWMTPSNQTVTLTNGQTTTFEGVFTPYLPAAPSANGLTLLTNGYGSIRHAAWPASLTIGTQYKVTAVPKAKNGFLAWIGGTSQPYAVLSTNVNYTFPMASNLVLEADFSTNVFLAAQGAYRGLFAPADSPRQQTNSGSFLFNVTSAGGVGGSLDLGGQIVPMSGKFNLDGVATLVAKRRGATWLTADLQLDFDAQTISGTISNSGFIAALSGFQNVFSAKEKATNYEGHYTLIIPGVTNPALGPSGTSIGTLTVTPTGGISFVGKLADGTPATQASTLSKDGLWPFYVSLYGGKGSIWSWNQISADAITSATNASWINETNSNHAALYRAGFTNNSLSIQGSYLNPTNAPLIAPTNPFVILSGGGLSDPITNQIAIAANNKITLTTAPENTNRLELSIAKATGAVTGSFANPTNGRSVRINGVLVQGQTNAQGYFLGPTNSGTFFLGSP